MRRVIFFFSVLILSLALKSCNSVEPPTGLTINLKLEDVSCTEAWIELTSTNLQFPTTITLKQNNQTRSSFNLIKADTLLYIDSLLPKQTYSFHAALQPSSPAGEVKSNVLNVTTMDTTSHNFTCQIFTFGEHSHSRLNDVAIISENNIWAVGEIYMNDSLGNPDNNAYNAVHWDGSQWEKERIKTNACGGVDYPPVKAIFAFSSTDILFAHIDGSISHYNGIEFTNDCSLITQLNGSANKMWGESNNNFYVVSGNGFIAHYNGTVWSRIESGTDVDLKDVWGTPDGTVWACGYSGDYAISALLKISGQQVEKIYEGFSSNQNNGYYVGPISGVWGTGNIRIYLMNWSGIYIQANSSNLFLEKEIAKFSDVGLGIDGTDDNNIFVCGEAFVGHWNGISYTEYPELFKDLRTFLSVSVKGNTVAAVGSDYNGFIYSQAVIALAK